MATPSLPASMLPRSPTWRYESVGAPCFSWEMMLMMVTMMVMVTTMIMVAMMLVTMMMVVMTMIVMKWDRAAGAEPCFRLETVLLAA